MNSAADRSQTLPNTLRSSPVRRSVASLMLATFMLSPYGVLAAPVADAGAPAGQRPSVTTAGSVSVVNITAPNASGISHNKYQSFDVPMPGVVLNNATAGANTTLAGTVAANPNLGGTAARVILNEVTGSQASLLAGVLEVAGASAKVILANPNGITCNGCGFINTPHVQLTTGRPTVSGGQITYDVLDGAVNIGPGGLNALALRLDILSRFINVAGPVSVGELNLLAGRAYADADTLVRSDEARESGTPPTGVPDGTYAIDISQSLQAGTIRLVVSQEPLFYDGNRYQYGRGIRATAPISATDDVIVAGAGNMALDSTSAGRNLAVVADHGDVTLNQAYAGDTLQVVAGSVTAPTGAHWWAANDIQLASAHYWTGAPPAISNLGSIEAGRDIVVGGLNYFWLLNGGTISAGRDFVAADPNTQNLGWRSITGQTGFHLLPLLKDAPVACSIPLADDPTDPYFYTRPVVHNEPTARIEAGRDAYLNWEPKTGGSVVAGNDVHLWGSDESRYWDMNMPSYYYDATPNPGTVQSGRNLVFHSLPTRPQYDYFDYFPFQQDRFQAGQDALFLSGGTNQFHVSAIRDILVTTTDDFANRAGSLVAGRDITISANTITNTAAVSTTENSYAAGHYPGCAAGNGGTCTATEDVYEQPSLISAGNNVTLTANAVANTGATILAGRNIDIQATDFANQNRTLNANWVAIPVQVSLSSSGGGGGSTGTITLPASPPVTGTTKIGEIPGIIQAGNRFLLAGIPQAGGSGSDPAATGGSSGTGASGSGNAPGSSGSGGSANPTAANSFTNTGTITAPVVAVYSNQILNGYGFNAFNIQTASPTLPPAIITLLAPSAALLPTALGPSSLASLLPASLQSPLPFALTGTQEETALQNALLANTSRAFIVPVSADDALSPATQQRAVLYANAIAWAQENSVPLGQAPSASQLADLSAPMLWYVAKGGSLVPTLYLPESMRASLAVLPGGNLTGLEAVSLDACSVENTGYLRSGGLLSITADSLANEKRNADFTPYDVEVDHGYVHVWGDTVQPGGFMQAAAWDLAVSRVSSVSGEFQVGSDAAASAALVAGLRASLGNDFAESVAQDHIHQEFVCTDCDDSDWFRSLLGVVLSFVVGFYVTDFVGAAIGAEASAGTTWAAGELGNAVVSKGLGSLVGNVASQLITTGEVNGEAALRAGLAGSFTAGVQGLSGGNWVVNRLADGVAGEIRGQSFAQALAWSVADSAGAKAANVIGSGLLGDPGTLSYTLAHGALGALLAEAKGMDPVAGAIGGVSEAALGSVVDLPTDANANYSGSTGTLYTALAMLTGGLASEAAGHDPLAAAMTAQNAALYNRLLHPDQVVAVNKKAKELAGQDGLSEEQWQQRLLRQALKEGDSAYGDFQEDSSARSQLVAIEISGGPRMSYEGTTAYDNHTLNGQYVESLRTQYNLAGNPSNIAPITPSARAVINAVLDLSDLVKQPVAVQRALFQSLLMELAALPSDADTISALAKQNISLDTANMISRTRSALAMTLSANMTVFLASGALTAEESQRFRIANGASAVALVAGSLLSAKSLAGAAGPGPKGGGQLPSFYVRANGEIVPATGYRYVSSDAPYLEDLLSSGNIPANTRGTYFSFNKLGDEAAGKLQVPHDAAIRIEFDTKQIIDDVQVPKGQWGEAAYPEPITKDFPQFGAGGATQAITTKPIVVNRIVDTRTGKVLYERGS